MNKAAIALLAGLTMAAPTAAFADTNRPVAVQVEKAASVKAPIQAESTNYAEREAVSKDAQNFQGGQTVVVFSGAALVALILLLLLI